MESMLTSEDIETTTHAERVLSSPGAHWGSPALRSYRFSDWDGSWNGCLPALQDFLVIAYNEPADLARRVQGCPWRHAIIHPGEVSLCTRGMPSEWKWTHGFRNTVLFIPHELMANVASETFDRDIDDVELRDDLQLTEPRMHSAVQELSEEAKDGGVGGRLYVEAIVTQLCIHILRTYACVTLRAPRTPGSLTPIQAKQVLEFIDANLEEDLSLANLAAVARVSPYHFSRLFKARFDSSPHAFVIRRRLLKARHLLIRGDVAIKEIASRTGFCDQSHMTRAFKRYFNTTPKAIRLSEN